MVVVRSYIKIGEDFIPVTDYNAPVPDRDYIDGAIELTINYTPILTTRHWDLVDQLWSYIIDGLEELVQGKSFETYFPDQPTPLSFDLVRGGKVKVSVQGTVKATAVTPLYEFLDAMTGAGELFLQKIILINPGYEAGYMGNLAQIERIREQMTSL